MACDTIAESVEVWKPHAASGGIYSVSSFGRVRREKRGRTRPPGGILVPARSAVGYDRVCLIYGGRQRCESVHRLVALAFIPNPQGLPQVNHKNGVKHDNRIENIEWISSRNNVLHSLYMLGNKPCMGETHYRSILNEMQARIVVACSRLNADRRWLGDLAKCFGVTRRCIEDIASGRNWKHLQSVELSTPGIGT
jgi:hypothetical protein